MPTPTRYGDLPDGLAELVADLTRGRIAADHPCHLDPDLDRNALVRLPGWRGAFGQVSAAQGHLLNCGVLPGDIFLFWGLFRPVIRNRSGKWSYTGTAEHRVFGWLQVEEVLAVGADATLAAQRFPWLEAHPHLSAGWPSNNTVYIARENMVVGGQNTELPGFGVFPRGLRLTAQGSTQPSLWRVPDWLHPLRGGTGMTYHRPESWKPDGTVRSAARGQEFVADIGQRRDAVDWLIRLLRGETGA